MTLPRNARAALPLLAVALSLVACAKVEIAAPDKAPLPREARMLLGKKQMTEAQPIFVRIFKAESELEVWKRRDDGHFHHFKTYPICNWSGGLGPKLQQGDKQSPEGFYQVKRHQMNPNSQFHLSFNLGFPNAYDRANNRTGDFLMVHGKCRSAGCYAMTDALIEEIYALARESFAGGQDEFHVHAFPFRMTEQNLARYQGDKNSRFWRSLKKGYDHFEATRTVPNVEVCERQYRVNVEWIGRERQLDPRGACPRFREGPMVPFQPTDAASDADRTRASGPAAIPVAPAPQPVTAPRPITKASARYFPPTERMSLVPTPRETKAPVLKPSLPPASARDPIADLLRK